MYETKSMEGTSLFRSSSWHGLETHFPTQKEDSEMKNSPLHSPFWSFPNPTPPQKKPRFSQQSCIWTLERCRMGFQSSVSKSPDDAPAYPNPPRTTSLHKREASDDTAGKMTLSFWGIIENVVQIYKDYYQKTLPVLSFTPSKKNCLASTCSKSINGLPDSSGIAMSCCTWRSLQHIGTWKLFPQLQHTKYEGKNNLQNRSNSQKCHT